MENKTIEVIGCNNCPLLRIKKIDTLCLGINEGRMLSVFESVNIYEHNYSPEWCPLRTNTITIKLKQDDSN